jgi:anti-sigma B factor antagonist
MKTPSSSLSVWVGDHEACIKIAGRASFNSSVDFKTLINSLSQRGYYSFVLDLTDCLLMDSTFLGVLAGLGLKFGAGPNNQSHPTMELLNPNARILDLLENLGVSHLFQVRNGVGCREMAPVESPPANADRKEVSRTCLEAHQTLMEINPANVPRFKDVAQFLAEDLKKMEEGDQSKTGGTRSDAGKPA